MCNGNNGGQRCISITGMKTNLLSSKSLGCFTLMGMTAATGEPVLCMCILATKYLSITYIKGFDYRASIPYESINNMEGNMGEVKEIPGLPVCKFRGELIPGLMCMYPKGSISSEILTEVLKYLDQLKVFEWHQDGPTPFGLLDCHGSRLQFPCLEYINSKTYDGLRKCIFTLVTPNATNVWQVEDSIN